MAAGPEGLYLDWRRKNSAVGCVFARMIAVTPARYGQVLDVSAARTPEKIAEDISARIRNYVADPNVTAAVLIFPELDELEVLARAALAVDALPDWHVSRTTLTATRAGDVVAFGITVAISHAGTEFRSEALVLGPFEAFPETRRAPVVAVEVFVGSPRGTDAKTGAPTTRTNLADIGVRLDDGAFKRTWAETEQARLQSLGGHDDVRAKARVSFVIPMNMAQDIGCVP